MVSQSRTELFPTYGAVVACVDRMFWRWEVRKEYPASLYLTLTPGGTWEVQFAITEEPGGSLARPYWGAAKFDPSTRKLSFIASSGEDQCVFVGLASADFKKITGTLNHHNREVVNPVVFEEEE